MRARYFNQVLRAANPPRNYSVPAETGVTGSSSCFDRDGQRLCQTRQIIMNGIVCYTTDGRIIVIEGVPAQYDRQRL